MENKISKEIEDIFGIVEIEKGDVNAKVMRQGCISVQTPNASEAE